MKQQLFLLLIVLISGGVFRATMAKIPNDKESGTINGKVISYEESEPLIGTTILITNTLIGTKAGKNGQFTLKNIPVGKHTLRVSSVGYATVMLEVVVQPGEEKDLLIKLKEANVLGQEVVISASKYEQEKSSVPVTTSIVSRQMIESQVVQTLDNVLQTVPGVDVIRSGGAGASNVQIRGSNSFAGGGLGTRVQFLYDGFLMNSPDANAVDWQSFGMGGIEQVEVVKGAASSLYGSAAMGGVINAIGALPNEFSLKTRWTSGFYSKPPANVNSSFFPGNRTQTFYNTSIEHGNRVGDLDYNVAFSRLNDEGYRDAGQFEMNDLKFKMSQKLTSSQNLQLIGTFNWSEGGVAYQWSQRSNALGIPNTLGQRYVLADDIKQTNAQMVGLKHNWLIGESVRLESRLSFVRTKFTIIYYPTFDPAYGESQPYLSGVNGRRGVYNPDDPNTFNDSDARRWATGSLLSWKIGSSHNFTSGYDLSFEQVRSTLYYNNQSLNFGGFIQDEWSITEKLKANVGVRYDLNYLPTDSVSFVDNLAKVQSGGAVVNTVTEAITTQSLNQFSPRFALSYLVNSDFSIRASVGKSFRAPALGERFITQAGFFLGNPNSSLKAERLTSYEVGFLKSFNKYVSVDMAVYLNNYDDLIESQNINPLSDPSNPQTSVFKFFNISKARIWGVETAVTLKPFDQISFIGGYNYMNAKDLDPASTDRRLGGNNNPRQPNGEPNNWLSYRPEHNLNYRVEVTPGMWFGGRFQEVSAFYSGRMVSRIRAVRIGANEAGRDYPGGFHVMDAGARVTLLSKLRLSASVRNLMNTQYEELEQYRSPGRSINFGVELIY